MSIVAAQIATAGTINKWLTAEGSRLKVKDNILLYSAVPP
jgi:hypothetical protein